MSRPYWTLLVIILQVASLAYIAINREWIRINGEEVYFSTAPVDPRDIFRGDYVALNYNINRPNISIQKAWVNQSFYATLEKDELGIASVTALTLEKPSSGLFIKARSASTYWNSLQRNPNIKYGIEKYFTEQGVGLELEEQRGRRDEWQTSLEMHVALGSGGTAVIKGHRWAQVSTRIEVIEAGNRNDNSNERANPLIKVSLRNNSVDAIQLLDSDNHCAFNINKNEQPMTFSNRDCSQENWKSITLAKDDTYEFNMDFEQSKWFVKDETSAEALSISDNGWGRFRLTYQPNVKRNDDYKDHYLSTLKTATFQVTGRVD